MSALATSRRLLARDVLRAAVTTGLTVVLVMLGAFSLSGSGDRVTDVLASWWPVLLLLVLQGVALVWSTRAPAVVLVIVAVTPFCTAFLDVAQISTVTTIPIMVAAYLAGTRSDGAPLRSGVLAAAVAVTAKALIGALQSMPPLFAVLTSIAQLLLVLGVPLVIAFVVVARRRLVIALRAEKEALERMQEALLQTAIAQERAGIARELHDIAAHHMSGIAIMCAAVERQVDTEPDAAKAGLRQIRTQSRLVLGDLRQVVGLLRGGAERGVETHRIDAVRDLVATSAADGESVDLHVTTRSKHSAVGDDLGPLAHLAGYRMVQESLANAARHAPGARREVHVDDTAPASLLITVGNGPAAHAPDPEPTEGFGLRGEIPPGAHAPQDRGALTAPGGRVGVSEPHRPGARQ
ncbi:histidine kinase [Sphaerisporangium sp. NPDC051017]|uniref:sensor histidine kinase n=1 Tax=Sphaerisporangium sp. NPDC051017 TaxID=3154636 RepID=UPI0034341189